MACIGFPLVGSTWVLVFVGGVVLVIVAGGLCGNSSWACAKASLTSFGAALNLCLNSLGDSIWCVSGF